MTVRVGIFVAPCALALGSSIVFTSTLVQGCRSRTFEEMPQSESIPTSATPVPCKPHTRTSADGTFVAFGVYDECLSSKKAVKVELHASPFPAAGATPVCVGRDAVERLDLSAYQFATANDYLSATQTGRVTDPAAFGVDVDKFKRRFRWVKLTLAKPLACASGKTALSGWMNTRDVMEIVERREKTPASTGTLAFAWPAQDTPRGYLKSQIVSGFGSTGEERRAVGLIGQFGPDGLLRRHGGIDIALPIGTPQWATAAGIVIEKGYNHRGGWYLDIRHDADTFSHYSHNETIEVKLGDVVKAGDAVSTVGFGGNATLPHIHFGIHRKGAYVDPLPLLASVPKRPFAPPVTPGLTPRKVHIWLGTSPLSRTVSTASLRTWMETGKTPSDVDGVLMFLDKAKRVELKKVLEKQLVFPFTVVQLDAFLRKAPVGVQILSDLAGAFNYKSASADPAAGLRGTLIGLSATGDSFGMLDVLENYPLEHINVNIQKALPAVEGTKDTLDLLKKLNQVHPL